MGKRVKGRENRGNLVLAAACLAFTASMVGMSYAAVPLYKMFCQVTGYGGTTQRVEQASDRILDKTITVRFDANTAGGLPWEFAPEQRDITMRIGETVKVAYKAKNLYPETTRGRASFNVTPDFAGAYFNKIECFCFTDTELKPGEALDMPVVFFIDPDIVELPEMKTIRTITLSYTFFPLEGDEPVATGKLNTTTDDNLGG
ncbi:MAG: cytochrome c oxidase assembly protein [Rhizobiaceae bacterium]